MGHVADPGEDFIVFIRIHDLDPRADTFPQGTDIGHVLFGGIHGCEDNPGAVEKPLSGCIRPRSFISRYGVGGNITITPTGRDCLAVPPNGITLYTARIRYKGVLFKAPAEDLPEAEYGHRKDNQVATAHYLRHHGQDLIEDTYG